MPWVRIDENIIDHPKFLALTPIAFWLWVEGLTYCQKHLTDGNIPGSVLKKMRHYSPSAVRCLTSSLVPDKGPLWHAESYGNIRVHDYLDHNDSRELVLKKRADAKGRMQRNRSVPRSREHGAEHLERVTANTPSGVVCSGESTKLLRREGGVGETRDRVGQFVDWYAEAHEKYIRVGYIASPQKDYQAAIALCEKFTDQELRDAALVWFGMDDDFATTGTRTLTKFLSRASDCVLKARRAAQRFSA
jgi:hypothetical protein